MSRLHHNPTPQGFFSVVTLIIILMVGMIISAASQDPCWTCPAAPVVTSLPFTDQWCIEQGSWGQCFYQNPDDLPDAVNDCWECMSNTRWYRVVVAPGGGLITMDLSFDLCNQNGSNCGEVRGYYHLFDGCPEDGGELLSMPRNPSPMPHCWNDDLIMLSCWDGQIFSEYTCFSGPPETAGGFVYNYPPSTNFSIEFELTAGEYYFCISPSSNCSSGSYGCVELSFDGPIILGLDSEQSTPPDEPQALTAPADGIYYTPGIGFYVLKSGTRYIYGKPIE